MVLVLMGIILSMVTISVGDGGKYRELEEEATRLKTLIGMAREEAILNSQDWVLAFKKDAYRFELEEVKEPEVVQDPNGQTQNTNRQIQNQIQNQSNETKKVKYVPITDKIFRERELEGYHLSLLIDEQEYIEKPAVEGDDEADILGRITLFSSGEISEDFEVSLEQEQGDDKFTLKGTQFGELELKSSRDDEI